jgi:hypothetical protein
VDAAVVDAAVVVEAAGAAADLEDGRSRRIPTSANDRLLTGS